VNNLVGLGLLISVIFLSLAELILIYLFVLVSDNASNCILIQNWNVQPDFLSADWVQNDSAPLSNIYLLGPHGTRFRVKLCTQAYVACGS